MVLQDLLILPDKVSLLRDLQDLKVTLHNEVLKQGLILLLQVRVADLAAAEVPAVVAEAAVVVEAEVTNYSKYSFDPRTGVI